MRSPEGEAMKIGDLCSNRVTVYQQSIVSTGVPLQVCGSLGLLGGEVMLLVMGVGLLWCCLEPMPGGLSGSGDVLPYSPLAKT